MSANKQLFLQLISSVSGVQTDKGTVSIYPARSRNGVFEYAGRDLIGDNIDLDLVKGICKATMSVRPGNAADYVQKIQAVKRKALLKVMIPISVPGEIGSLTSYIIADLAVQIPVEATESQVQTALASCFSIAKASTSPAFDLTVNGREPY